MQTATHDASLPARPSGGSGEMFDQIAKRYDLLNRVMSLGLDRSWRRKLVSNLSTDVPARVLDVATGTADVALDIAKTFPPAEVVGLDPSRGMLDVGVDKIEAAGLSHRVSLIQGDAQEMPFADDSFDAACISFGIRNVPDRMLGLQEMTRVVRRGGRVVVLELNEPEDGVLAPFARFHVHHVVPRLGALISGAKEYRYLQESIAAFPAPQDFAQMMGDAGLSDVQVIRMSFGAAHLFVGTV